MANKAISIHDGTDNISILNTVNSGSIQIKTTNYLSSKFSINMPNGAKLLRVSEAYNHVHPNMIVLTGDTRYEQDGCVKINGDITTQYLTITTLTFKNTIHVMTKENVEGNFNVIYYDWILLA